MEVGTMIIRTDKVTANQLHRSTPSGVYAEIKSDGASRTHRRRFDVGLCVLEGGKGTSHPYRRNTGQWGAEDGFYPAIQWAASYDEWGEWLAALFEVDPGMIAGQYKGRDDFHRQTEGKYR